MIKPLVRLIHDKNDCIQELRIILGDAVENMTRHDECNNIVFADMVDDEIRRIVVDCTKLGGIEYETKLTILLAKILRTFETEGRTYISKDKIEELIQDSVQYLGENKIEAAKYLIAKEREAKFGDLDKRLNEVNFTAAKHKKNKTDCFVHWIINRPNADEILRETINLISIDNIFHTSRSILPSVFHRIGYDRLATYVDFLVQQKGSVAEFNALVNLSDTEGKGRVDYVHHLYSKAREVYPDVETKNETYERFRSECVRLIFYDSLQNQTAVKKCINIFLEMRKTESPRVLRVLKNYLNELKDSYVGDDAEILMKYVEMEAGEAPAAINAVEDVFAVEYDNNNDYDEDDYEEP